MNIRNKKKHLLKFLSILLLFCSLKSLASSWTGPGPTDFSVRTGVVGSQLSEDIQGPALLNAPNVNYIPNAPAQTIYGINIGKLGFSYGKLNALPQDQIFLKGNTLEEDYQFRIFGEKNTFDVFYQKYSGYYLNNSEQMDGVSRSSGLVPYLQRSDIHVEHYGLQYFRTLNDDNFSLAANFDQVGWQNQSGGSWFFYTGLDQHHIGGSSSFIPTQAQKYYPQFVNFRSGEFQSLKVGLGGGYSLVFGGLYIAGMLNIDGGQQRQRYELGTEKTERWVPGTGGNLKLSFGYNGKTLFSCFNFFQDSTDVKIADATIHFATMESSFHLGLHF